jgi:hypothetical protein
MTYGHCLWITTSFEIGEDASRYLLSSKLFMYILDRRKQCFCFRGLSALRILSPHTYKFDHFPYFVFFFYFFTQTVQQQLPSCFYHREFLIHCSSWTTFFLILPLSSIMIKSISLMHHIGGFEIPVEARILLYWLRCFLNVLIPSTRMSVIESCIRPLSLPSVSFVKKQITSHSIAHYLNNWKPH